MTSEQGILIGLSAVVLVNSGALYSMVWRVLGLSGRVRDLADELDKCRGRKPREP